MATTLYVEARQCTACTHIGLNDSSDTHSVCTSCPWAGPTPAADCCPECGATGTMSAACPKCGESYVLMAESELPLTASAPNEASLLRQALKALEYHLAQTRPIDRTTAAIAAIRSALTGTHQPEWTRSECDSPELCAVNRQCAAQYGTKRICSVQPVAVATAPVASGDERDAARYRWLRQDAEPNRKGDRPWCVVRDSKGYAWAMGSALDEHIDAAIAAKNPEPQGAQQ